MAWNGRTNADAPTGRVGVGANVQTALTAGLVPDGFLSRRARFDHAARTCFAGDWPCLPDLREGRNANEVERKGGTMDRPCHGGSPFHLLKGSSSRRQLGSEPVLV